MHSSTPTPVLGMYWKTVLRNVSLANDLPYHRQRQPARYAERGNKYPNPVYALCACSACRYSHCIPGVWQGVLRVYSMPVCTESACMITQLHLNIRCMKCAARGGLWHRGRGCRRCAAATPAALARHRRLHLGVPVGVVPPPPPCYPPTQAAPSVHTVV